MIQPFELSETRPMGLYGGVVATTTDVWNMLSASRSGDLARVKELMGACPSLVSCMFDYTTPLHFAVTQGHFNVVRYLVSEQALDPTYLTHPFRDSLVTMAQDRGQIQMAEFLTQSLANPALTFKWGDTGEIRWNWSELQNAFQHAVDHGGQGEAESMLAQQPNLALDRTAFWGEGILSMPAKGGDQAMVELLMRHGATVPGMSKWGARYYFKRLDMAAFLLERGMNPNHKNWRGFTLLHDMAFVNDPAKARLLLDRGADIEAIDDDYRSTPLGYAARWGKGEMVKLLLDCGADPNGAGAPWARPLAWAEKKGHGEIASLLKSAGASA